MDDPSKPPADAAGGTRPEAPSTALAPQVFSLASGRSIEVVESPAEDRIQIRSNGGELVLALRLTDEGPVLSLSGVSLELIASKTLSLACETLRISAAKDASVDVGGSLRERVEGSVSREVAGASTLTAREVRVEASPGGMVLKANDDVAITGERVRLNSDDPPMPLTWEEHRARRALAAGAAPPQAAEAAALPATAPGPPER